MIIFDILYIFFMYSFIIAFGILLIESYVAIKVLKKVANKSKKSTLDYNNDTNFIKINIEEIDINQIISNNIKNNNYYYINDLFVNNNEYNENSILINMFYKENTNKYDIFIENFSDIEMINILEYCNVDENTMKIFRNFIQKNQFKHKIE
jgi:hypothetical protein